MDDINVNKRLSKTEPYEAVAKTVLETALEDDLELPEVLRAIRTAFLDCALSRCSTIEQKVNKLQSDFKEADAIVQALKRE